MASIDFTKAVIETGYLEIKYEPSDYAKLSVAIKEICWNLVK